MFLRNKTDHPLFAGGIDFIEILLVSRAIPDNHPSMQGGQDWLNINIVRKKFFHPISQLFFPPPYHIILISFVPFLHVNIVLNAHL
jgi:hypothetical protein